MPTRRCLASGCPERIRVQPGQRNPSRCPAHERQLDQQRGTTTERGYGAEHQQLRARLVAALDPWAPCPRCGDPLGPDPNLLDLGHVDGDRTRYSGLEHRECNRGRRRLDRASQITPIVRVEMTPAQPDSRLHSPAGGG